MEVLPMQGKGFVTRMMVGLALLTAASSVFAAMSIPYGWYLEGNAGSTNLTKKSYPGSASTSGLGGNMNVGYKFIPYFATEVGYSIYATTSINAPGGTQAGQDKHYSYDIAARGILPVCKTGLEFFAKLGISHLTSTVTIKNNTAAALIGLTSSNNNDVNAYTGLGAQYFFIPEIAAVVQWQRAFGSDSTGNLDLYSGGLTLLVD